MYPQKEVLELESGKHNLRGRMLLGYAQLGLVTIVPLVTCILLGVVELRMDTQGLLGLGLLLVLLSLSGIFSGSNVGIPRRNIRELAAMAKEGNRDAQTLLKLRGSEDQHLTAINTSVLFSNTAVNVGIASLSGWLIGGLAGGIIATLFLMTFGEVMPQGRFIKQPLVLSAKVAPLIRFFAAITLPVAWWFDSALRNINGGAVAPPILPEASFAGFVDSHVDDPRSDVSRVEGALVKNSFTIDDLTVGEEGELLDPESVVVVPFESGLPILPKPGTNEGDTFLETLNRSGKRWVILICSAHKPRRVVDAKAYIAAAATQNGRFAPSEFIMKPVIVDDRSTTLDKVLPRLQAGHDDRLHKDVILVWDQDPAKRRIITASDLVGFWLRGVAEVREEQQLPVRITS